MKTNLPWCRKCYGKGIHRATLGAKAGPYVRCDCGRLPNATSARKLADQARKEERLIELQSKQGKGW